MRNAAKLGRNLLIAASLLFCAQAHAQTLVYAVCQVETPASFRARYPYGAIVATPEQRSAMLRACRKAEIYSVSMIDGKRALLFSDEGMDLDITPTGATLGAGKAYTLVREWRTTPNPGGYSQPTALYELTLDGSNRTRRLLRPGHTKRRLC